MLAIIRLLRENISQNYHHIFRQISFNHWRKAKHWILTTFPRGWGEGNKTRRRQSLVNHPSIPPCKLSIRTEMMSIRHFHKVNIQSRVNPGDLSRLILQSWNRISFPKTCPPPPLSDKFNTTTNIENIVQSSSSSVSAKPRTCNLDW